jgi:hypothetical protein
MNPFVGLRPFREDERHLFMGRELASTYVETKSSINPLTLLFARSGIGKSSFLTSRLIPHLREGNSILYLNEWGRQRPETIIEEGISYLDTTERRSKYLILDQFEDVFKQDLDRRNLWDCLAQTANADQADKRIIVTMREEWLGAWEEAEQYIPTAYGSMVRLAPLTYKELRRAIVSPIEIAKGVRIEQGLIDILLQDLRRQNAYGLGEAFVEPGLLQLVCQRLWDEAAQSDHIIDQSLYERLGGANAIIQNHVWRHLRVDSHSEETFRADQRVLWAGLVRHLSMAHGVKATVTPDMLSRKLLLVDLGIAGPAVAAGKGLSVRSYLATPVEQRGESPEPLRRWISETLEVGLSFGFLKRQQGFKNKDSNALLYELSHDGLDDIFRSFALEFEKWVTKRVLGLWAFAVIVLFILPYFSLIAWSQGIVEAVLAILAMLLAGLIYGAVLWVMMKIYPYIAAVVYYPFVRWLVKGPVKMKKSSFKTSR